MQNLSDQCSRLKEELAEAKAGAAAGLEHAAQAEKLRRELVVVNDELSMTSSAFQATKESFSQISANHDRELEDKIQQHIEEIQALKTQFAKERTQFDAVKARLQADLEDEKVAKEHAKAEALAAQTALQTPPMSPKQNGNAHPPTPMVAREELQKIHEAHSAKVSELEAEHTKGVRLLKDEVSGLQKLITELQGSLDSKCLELQFAASEKEELEDELAKLKAGEEV